MKLKDLTGQRFGRLVVLERAGNKGKYVAWRCKCDCGCETVVRSGNLKNGHTSSCGCWHDESSSQRSITHGMSHSKVFKAWVHIKDRCLNPNDKSYKNYGGRGITLYAPWVDDFQAFYNYVSTLEHYGEDGMTLDRENVNGNYEPGNLRWATQKEQQRNRRNNVVVEYQGEEMALAEAADRSGVPYKTLHRRYHHGDRGEKLFRPLRGK